MGATEGEAVDAEAGTVEEVTEVAGAKQPRSMEPPRLEAVGEERDKCGSPSDGADDSHDLLKPAANGHDDEVNVEKTNGGDGGEKTTEMEVDGDEVANGVDDDDDDEEEEEEEEEEAQMFARKDSYKRQRTAGLRTNGSAAARAGRGIDSESEKRAVRVDDWERERGAAGTHQKQSADLRVADRKVPPTKLGSGEAVKLEAEANGGRSMGLNGDSASKKLRKQIPASDPFSEGSEDEGGDDDQGEDEFSPDAGPRKVTRDVETKFQQPRSRVADVGVGMANGVDEQGDEEDETSRREQECAAFQQELQAFFEERGQEFKVPKFYGEEVDLLKLWEIVCCHGGFDKVTSGKLWRAVGHEFHPPKSCTTVSWSFRCFYEKALLDYERHIGMEAAMLSIKSLSRPAVNGVRDSTPARKTNGSLKGGNHHGGHVSKMERNGLTGDKGRRDQRDFGGNALKKKRPMDGKGARTSGSMPPSNGTSRIRLADDGAMAVISDVGRAADWVRVNVRQSADCYEIYALVPGLMREEVRVQCEPAGKVLLAGEPEQPDSPWGVTAFKKVILLPSAIRAYQTTAVVTLHGQLYIRAPLASSKPPPGQSYPQGKGKGEEEPKALRPTHISGPGEQQPAGTMKQPQALPAVKGSAVEA